MKKSGNTQKLCFAELYFKNTLKKTSHKTKKFGVYY